MSRKRRKLTRKERKTKTNERPLARSSPDKPLKPDIKRPATRSLWRFDGGSEDAGANAASLGQEGGQAAQA